MRCCGHSRFPLIRRAVALYAAVSVLFFSVVGPARAFAPVAVLAAPQIVSAGGASYGLAALAGLIGLTGLYLNIPDADGNSSRIPLSDRPDAVPPPPVAEPTAPGQPSQSCQSSAIGGTYPSMGALCNAVAAAQSAQLCGGIGSTSSASCAGTNSGGFSITSSCTLQSGAVIGPYTQPYAAGCSAGPETCPPGYIAGGSGCVLSNPREAKPDKNCDLGFNAQRYMYYNDSDCPSGPTIDRSKSVPGIRQGGEIGYVYGKDSMGRPMLVEVVRNGDGTQTVVRQFVQDGPNVQTTTATVDAATGQIKSVSSSTNPGQITAPATEPVDSNTPKNATTTPTATTDPTRDKEIVFPDDYAREPTLQATKSAIEQLHKDLTDKEAQDDPEVPGSSEFNDSFFNGTFDALKGWSLPGHTSTCPVGSFDWNGSNYSINAHCQLVTNHFSALQAAMTVVWSLLALFIVLRA